MARSEYSSLFPFTDLDADGSADLIQALRKDPVSDALRDAAVRHHHEADQAVEQVEQGHDFAVNGSWVAEVVGL